MNSSVVVAFLTVLSLSVRAAESDSQTFTDPTKAGPDYPFQGEYISEGSAAQVIALGDGKFKVVGFAKGLPGQNSEVEKKVEVTGQREGDRVLFDNNGWKGDLSGSTLTGTNDEGQTFVLKKIERKSPTLGAKPPEGAIVLFDGSNADAWDGGSLDEDGNLKCGVKSKKSFGDCTLHVEFRTPFMPAARGQGRGNSGVYLQDRYEVQVLDSFGLSGENNECGGIYTVAAPTVNMCFPPLTWQTYDIDFEAAKYDADGKKNAQPTLTVKHNGVLVQDHVKVGKATTSAGRPEGSDKGPIQLQNHGNPVVYRNIWIVDKSK